MNVYDAYFKGLKDFCIKINLATISDFEGMKEDEIKKLEKNVDFEFGLGMSSYLSYFGKKLNIRNIGMSSFTEQNIKRATKEANQADVSNKIIKGTLVHAWDEEEIINDIEKVCFLDFFEVNYYFTFIANQEENPTLYGWDGTDESYKHTDNLTDSFRSTIVQGLKNICDIRRLKREGNLAHYRVDNYERTVNVEIDGISWLRIYQEQYVNQTKFVLKKHDFDKKIKDLEVRENRLVDIEEYGIGLQEFLQKN